MYRNKNLISDQLKLSSNLYSDLKRKIAGGKDFDFGNMDQPDIQVDEQLEREYLKGQIMMVDDIDPIDSQPKELVGAQAFDSYYKHYKVLKTVEQ